MKKITQETINKISETKLEAGRKNIIEGFIKNDIQKQSDIKLAIPSHRTSKWISFEEFKALMSNGKSLKELSKLYSKHLMAFYSALSQGKITLTKEQFIEEYEKGIPLDEIAKSHKIPREHITYLREYYGIKRKGATFQKRLKNEVPLSQDAKDIIIGSLLGDGHITPLGCFSEKHSEKQIQYLEWKANILQTLVNGCFSIDKNEDERYFKDTINYSFILRTKAHNFLYEMRKNFYITIKDEHIKIIPNNIEELMSETSLAVWFMDDGHTGWGDDRWNMSPQCKISSEGFSLNDNIKLQKMLINKFGIETYLKYRDKEKTKAFIKFNGVNSIKLLNIVKKYATPDMLYKVDRNVYFNYKEKKDLALKDRKELMRNKELIAIEFAKKHKIEYANNEITT